MASETMGDPRALSSNEKTSEAGSGASSGMDQQGQTVQSTQTNVAGPVIGPVLSGQFESAVAAGSGDPADFRNSSGAIYKPSGPVSIVYGSEVIDWDKVDLTAHLSRVRSLYAGHMQRFAGARDETDASNRYVFLRLQEDKASHHQHQPQHERYPPRAEIATTRRHLGRIGRVSCHRPSFWQRRKWKDDVTAARRLPTRRTRDH